MSVERRMERSRRSARSAGNDARYLGAPGQAQRYLGGAQTKESADRARAAAIAAAKERAKLLRAKP